MFFIFARAPFYSLLIVDGPDTDSPIIRNTGKHRSIRAESNTKDNTFMSDKPALDDAIPLLIAIVQFPYMHLIKDCSRR